MDILIFNIFRTKKTKEVNKYLYLIDNPWKVRILYIIGIICWVGVVYGYFRFFRLNPLYFYIIGPFVAYFTVYYSISCFINLFYTKFDLLRHNKLVKEFWTKFDSKKHTIDFFIPTCGEDISILERTFEGIRSVKYTNKKVYILDDKGDTRVKRLANKYGFTYLSRDNKGEMKKAGNLKYGFERSNGEFIVVFDADFVAHPDFVKELLPYMNDSRNAIVQSPQFFQVDGEIHNRSALEYGAGHVQEDFYRIIQVSRDHFDAAICVGSCAIYRRKALLEVGGTAQIEHSEDVHTGFNLMLKGYKVKYIPLILARGLCPDNLHSYFHQQHRWCSGSMSLLFSRKFWDSRISFFQKLCFMSGFMYYISHLLILILAFQFFLILFFHYDTVNIKNALPFYPSIIYSCLVS